MVGADPWPTHEPTPDVQTREQEALLSVKETMAGLAEVQSKIARQQEANRELQKSINAATKGLEKKLKDASDALDTAIEQMETAMTADKKTAAQLFGLRSGQSRPAQSRWKRPNASEREAAVKESTREKKVPKEFLSPDSHFRPVPLPSQGEWLDQHRETGQTFRSFNRLSMKVVPHGHVRVIELVPVGPFQAGRSPDLDKLRRYVACFFGIEARVAEPLDLLKTFTAETSEPRGPREGMEGQLQLCTNDIFDLLRVRMKQRSSRDVLCSVVITMADLFCVKNGDEAWNFVFGQALLMDGIGCFSFARYDPTGSYALMWEGKPDGSNYQQMSGTGSSTPMSDDDASRLLQRACKVCVHETGHIFGLKHCVFYDCLMNGANHLEEFDKRTMHLCPVCLRKLHSSVRFGVVGRASALCDLYQEFGWDEELEWTRSWLGAVDGT